MIYEYDEGFILPPTIPIIISTDAPTVTRMSYAAREEQHMFSLRIREADRRDIDDAAKVLDLSTSAFVRVCAVGAADEVLREYNEYNKRKAKRR